MTQGKFITLEGSEGVGKSTQLKKIAAYLQAQGLEVITTREPGGTPFAEQIRQLLLNKAFQPQEKTELMLMYASRVEHWLSKIKPALAKGIWVISDRFADASFAYQGFGRGMELELIEQLHHWALGSAAPDLTLWLQMPLEQAMARVDKRGDKDRFEEEKRTFFQRVNEGYAYLAQKEPERIKIIPAMGDEETVFAHIKPFLESLNYG